jgi:DNA-binding CsgD family transcriptional regulator/tetratricopeptide (TPR) repeat protein
MTGMARRPTSARLVGREEELNDLLDTLASHDPDRPVVLVAGEAGIGKTRLLTEVVGRLGGAGAGSSPWTIVRGSCLRLADGELPFAPILEILDALRDRVPAGTVDALRARLAGGGEPARGGTRSAEARTVRFIEIHGALVAAAGGSPLLVVLDDLHWADQSTLDLVLFLARRLRGSSVVLLAAFRSDELHRRHPLRPVVAELSRGFVRERIDLEPLTRAEVEQQISELRGTEHDDLVRQIVDRADGNPFYVEELVALDSGRSALPASVRDVLLARLAALDATTGRVLAACAVIGREVDPELLVRVLDLDAATVIASVGSAVDHSFLVPTASANRYRFRHALLEEAVHDDLLPGDRVELHRRVAAALSNEAGTWDVPPGELARHLDLGGDPAAAIDAYLDAASLAFRALAWAEGIAAFERAAELAARERLGEDEASARWLRDLVIPAAQAMEWSGSASRALTVLREWIARTDADAERPFAAWLWLTLTQALNDIGDEVAAVHAMETTARLYPPDENTALGVEVLIGLTSGAWIQARSREAIRLAERAVAGAERLDDTALVFRSLIERAAALIIAGQVERGLADVERARRLQSEHGWLDAYGHLPTNIGNVLADVGLLAPALELWQEGLRMSKELGVERSWDPWNLPGLAICAFHLGRWSEADVPIAESRAFDAAGMPSYYNEANAALLAAGRGDLEACDAAIASATQHAEGLVGEFEAVIGLSRAARADAADDQSARLDEAEAAIRTLEGTDSFVLRSRLAAEAASAAADLVAVLHPKRDRARIASLQERARAAATFAADVDAGRVVAGTMSVPWTRANAALAAAEAARAEGRDDPAAWPPIADGFEAMGMRPRVAYAKYRAADAALRTGDRSAAETALVAAAELTRAIGMTVLRGRVETLARAARLDLGQKAARPPTPKPREDPWGLSVREREVLALLAEGRTNGEIGARLFISTKTASVHVTHILDKLGVSSRTEAALLANRVGLP